MKKQLLSFRDLLKTGRLGSISPGITRAEIAELLGTPEHADPDYWTFGKLEFSFDREPPHQMNWFQIEHASYLKGKLEAVTDRVSLSLDGFSGKTKPSQILAANLWPPVEAMLFYTASTGDIDLNICAGPLQIHFRIDTDFIEDRDTEKYLNSVSVCQLISDIDHRTKIDSIYSYPHPAVDQITGAIDWNPIGGQEYLNSLV
ncbi:hypothetical protein [Mesorhizobium sp. ES1-4]|uniref:hypothetical protein n=1 Tax=Mesorhizobium sp. ES1-4 TaxID=2876627 RepID=UPI001CCF6B88|nr:hypothetical protein [Mesorhizobium sp. ES1-4]MBZ9794199.1 hypothetical protein [Mesorhizobium sp. ES1-4]